MTNLARITLVIALLCNMNHYIWAGDNTDNNANYEGNDEYANNAAYYGDYEGSLDYGNNAGNTGRQIRYYLTS